MARDTLFFLTLLGALLLPSTLLTAADAPAFGSNWWQEYSTDSNTLMLFHFGRPEPSPWDQLVDAGLMQREEKQEENELFDGAMELGEDTDGGEFGELHGQFLDDQQVAAKRRNLLPPVDEHALPTTEVLDYGWAQQRAVLGRGVKAVPEGRFGAGLVFDGTGPGVGMPLAHSAKRQLAAPTMIECWVKIAAYPKAPACIISTGGDEAKLVLHPDGRVELIRRSPHGYPQKGNFERFATLAEYEVIFDAPTEMKSSTRVPLDTWTHIAASRGQAAQIEAQTAFLFVNGKQEASFSYSRWNWANLFVGKKEQTCTLGNNREKTEPFVGWLDEFRVSSGNISWGMAARHFNSPQTYAWREEVPKRKLNFDKPYFLESDSVFHLSFDQGMAFDFHKAGAPPLSFDRQVKRPTAFITEGIRGKGYAIDPRVGRLRIPAKGLSLEEGALEFWAQPLNWDNSASFPIMRIICEGENGEPLDYLQLRLSAPRDNGAPTFHPGVWNHFCLTWIKSEPHQFRLYQNHANRWNQVGNLRVGDPELRKLSPATLRLLFLEFGVNGQVDLGQGREPMIVIDEVVGYRYAMVPHEVTQAYERIQQELAPIKLFDLAPDYKYSIAELTATFEALLPRGVTAKTVTVEAVDIEGKPVGKAMTKELAENKASFLFAEGRPLPSGIVTFKVRATDPGGKVVIDDKYQDWGYIRRPWRDNKIGVPITTPEPWQPITVASRTLRTLMTTYELADTGLPKTIQAKGENLLARPVQLLENGEPMTATGLKIGPSEDVEMTWSATFKGKTCSIDMNCRLEFDGLIRFEMDIHPGAKEVGRIDFEIPLKSVYATRRFYQSSAHWGPIQVTTDTPAIHSPRQAILVQAQQVWDRKRDTDKGERPTLATARGYDFWSQMDLNNLERGLYWFADNAAGWWQSDRLPTQEFVKTGDEHAIVCHLIAEPVAYENRGPIVFGILPHPARPLPADYRYLGNAPSPQDPNAATLYASTFYPWPTSPTAGDMKVYPAKGSWEYAESLIPQMAAVVKGYRTLYQSIGYMSCRAGSYDGWEWRNGNGSRISLTKRFVEYCTWEMKEWISRGIFDAIYLDDSYAVICNNAMAVKAGQAIRLPDGSIQGGHRIWQFRELMKRWRQLFIESGQRPMLISHHSNHWLYPGMVFAENSLDGEGYPTITLGGRRDFMEALNPTRFEVVSNPHLWGVPRTYMASIWAKGPGNKGAGGGSPWAWRMARSAQAMLAHLENPVNFVDEGGSVYKAYWKTVLDWGAGQAAVAFIPYYATESVLTVEGQGSQALVSVYRDKGRVLVIASNKLKDDRKIEIDLDLKALGLRAKPTCRSLDADYDPPPGIDPWLVKAELPVAPVTDIGMTDPLDDEIDDLGLEDEREVEAKVAAAAAKAELPTLTGNRLTIPVRSHDFRVIAVE